MCECVWQCLCVCVCVCLHGVVCLHDVFLIDSHQCACVWIIMCVCDRLDSALGVQRASRRRVTTTQQVQTQDKFKTIIALLDEAAKLLPPPRAEEERPAQLECTDHHLVQVFSSSPPLVATQHALTSSLSNRCTTDEPALV